MESALQEAIEVIRALQFQGHDTYFVGGCVRDTVLERPVKDYDIVTSALPDEVMEIFPNTTEVGKSFGIVPVKWEDHWFEVATMREERGYSDNRHPDEVTYTDNIMLDLQRRDFTINGLVMDPSDMRPFGVTQGFADLEDEVIRCIGNPDDRFEEDALRMLRAIRFAVQLDFVIHPDTWASILKLAPTIANISRERIRMEVEKMLTTGGAGRALALLESSGILPVIFPEVAATRGVEQSPEHHPEGDVLNHIKKIFDIYSRSEMRTPTLSWAILFHDVAKTTTQEWDEEKQRWTFNGHAKEGAAYAEAQCKGMGMSKKETEQIVAICRDHMKMHVVEGFAPKNLRKLFMKDHAEELIEFGRIDALGASGDLVPYNFAKEKYDEFLADKANFVEDLLQGRDLIDAGMSPGPEFGKVLAEAKDLQLEGELQDREQALEWLRNKVA